MGKDPPLRTQRNLASVRDSFALCQDCNGAMWWLDGGLGLVGTNCLRLRTMPVTVYSAVRRGNVQDTAFPSNLLMDQMMRSTRTSLFGTVAARHLLDACRMASRRRAESASAVRTKRHPKTLDLGVEFRSVKRLENENRQHLLQVPHCFPR